MLLSATDISAKVQKAQNAAEPLDAASAPQIVAVTRGADMPLN